MGYRVILKRSSGITNTSKGGNRNLNIVSGIPNRPLACYHTMEFISGEVVGNSLKTYYCFLGSMAEQRTCNA